MQNGVSNGESGVTNVDALVVGAGFSGIAMLVSLPIRLALILLMSS